MNTERCDDIQSFEPKNECLNISMAKGNEKIVKCGRALHEMVSEPHSSDEQCAIVACEIKDNSHKLFPLAKSNTLKQVQLCVERLPLVDWDYMDRLTENRRNRCGHRHIP